MSPRQWKLDPLEFTALWAQFGRDRLPYPFQYRSTEEFADEYHRAYSEAAARVRKRLDEHLYRAFATLAETSMWMAAFGLDRIGAPDERVVRVHTGVNMGIATVAVQDSGVSEDSGGDIQLTLVNARNAPARIAAALPAANAGTYPAFSIRESELQRRIGDSVLSDPRTTSAREQMSKFAGRPRVSAGEIIATPGIAIDTRPNPETRGFNWVDYANDGRYLTRRTDTISAEPASEDIVAERIRMLAASVLRRSSGER